MSDTTPQIAGLGNPLVDVVANVDEGWAAAHDMTKGEMHLVDADQSKAIYDEIGPGLQQSGGSVGNTIAHIGAMGLKGTFIGKVADDDLGRTFRSEMAALGIDTPVAAQASGNGTGRCMSMVTPDGERTMATFLGACLDLAPGDLPASLPAETAIVLIEGYVFDAPHGADNIAKAIELARAVGAKVAMTPSDAGCVERQKDGMLELIKGSCDILIGNEDELAALSGTQDSMAALKWAMEHVETVALTRSADGSLLAHKGEIVEVGADKVDKVVDTTGAGDAYAAGFLGSLAQGKSLEQCGREGARLAAQVIGHMGAREAAA